MGQCGFRVLCIQSDVPDKNKQIPQNFILKKKKKIAGKSGFLCHCQEQ